MQKTMFLNNITQIDYAYVDTEGYIKGDSLRVDVLVSGEMCPKEKVVIDFSQCKKRIKQVIDDNDKGFDHKLWLYDDSNLKLSMGEGADVKIVTPFLSVSGHISLMRFVAIDQPFIGEHEALQKYIARYIEKELSGEFKGIKIEVALSRHLMIYDGLTEDTTFLATFNYVHGLKDSSSWGCQNIAHGHHSYIELILDENNHVCDLGSIRQEFYSFMYSIKDTIFVNEENIVGRVGNNLKIEYESYSRGKFSMTMDTDHINVIILKTETTVEFLADWVEERLSHFKEYGVKRIYVSEGITKGAMVNL